MKPKKLTVEEYLDFKENRDLFLTCYQLRQIISMHGGIFERKAHKGTLSEIVAALDLMELGRSTLLEDAVSGDAYLTETEIIRDLKDLSWQECSITSILSLGAGGRSASPKLKKQKQQRVRISPGSTTLAEGSTTQRPKKRKKRVKKLDISPGSTTLAGGSTTQRVASP